MITGRIPCDTTRRNTLDVLAPSAMRMPISVRRRDTLYDNTPYTPASASSNGAASVVDRTSTCWPAVVSRQ